MPLVSLFSIHEFILYAYMLFDIFRETCATCIYSMHINMYMNSSI